MAINLKLKVDSRSQVIGRGRAGRPSEGRDHVRARQLGRDGQAAMRRDGSSAAMAQGSSSSDHCDSVFKE